MISATTSVVAVMLCEWHVVGCSCCHYLCNLSILQSFYIVVNLNHGTTKVVWRHDVMSPQAAYAVMGQCNSSAAY
jgi:hypothetical protein